MPELPKLNQEELERREAYQIFFDTESGQRIMADLKERYYDANLLVRTSTNSTLYNLGMRDVVRYLMTMEKEK